MGASSTNATGGHDQTSETRARLAAEESASTEVTTASRPISELERVSVRPRSAPPSDAQLLRHARNANTELELLYLIEQQVTASEDLTDLIARVLDHLATYSYYEASALLLVTNGEGEVSSVLRAQSMTQRPVSRTLSFTWLEQTRVRNSRVVETSDGLGSVLADMPGARLVRVYNAPLSGGGSNYGVLQLIAPRDMLENEETVLRRLSLVAGQLGRAIMLRREREQLLRAERMAELGQTLGAVAHELHTPLLAVAGYVEIMASADAQEVRREYAERIGRGLSHIERTVQEALAYARGQREVSPVSLSVPRFMEEAREWLEPELARFGATLEVKSEYPGHVRLDASKIKRVLWTLTGIAGQVGGKKITWTSSRVGEYLVLQCHATGSAMPDDLVERIDDALADKGTRPVLGSEASGDPRYGNAFGLGLAMVRKIIDAHCGHIRVKSEPRHGTVVRIELPC